MAKTKLEKAVKTLIKELKMDDDYRRCWVANIAMAYLDADAQYKRGRSTMTYLNKNDKHTIANLAAENFINLLCKKVKKSK
jgi:hypothetical protein